MTGPHVDHGGRWTLGVIVGLPLLILLLAAIVVGLWFSARWLRREDRNGAYGDWWVALGAVIALSVGIVAWSLGVGFGYWPWSAEYHQYRHVSGTVDKVTSRLLSGSGKGGTDQKFVVVFRGSTQPFGVNDTRAALVKPGDRIDLSCIRTYDYGSTAGYDCKWGKP